MVIDITENGRKLNTALNIICYISLAIGLFTGTVTDILLILLVYLFIGINEQAFFHRMITHKSWNCPRWLKIIGIHISTLSILGPVIPWVSMHREHHRYTDTPKDPHSPLYKSRFDIQFKSGYLPEIKPQYIIDLLREDKIYSFYTLHYFKIVFTSWFLIACLIGIENFFTIWLAGTALVILFANGINSLHHGSKIWTGQYQLYKGKDTAKNDILLGYLHFDGWHNNHHTNANKYYYGDRWWEFDLCGVYIWTLATLTGYNNSLKKT